VTISFFTAWAAVVAAIVASPALSSDAEPYELFSDGEELSSTCAAGRNFSAGACLGYIVGALDAFAIVQQTGYCAPSGLSRGQVRDIVVAWLGAHPEKLQGNASAAVYNAMADSFPCRRK